MPWAAAQAPVIELYRAVGRTSNNHECSVSWAAAHMRHCTKCHELRLKPTSKYSVSCRGQQASNLPLRYAPWTAVPSRTVLLNKCSMGCDPDTHYCIASRGLRPLTNYVSFSGLRPEHVPITECSKCNGMWSSHAFLRYLPWATEKPPCTIEPTICHALHLTQLPRTALWSGLRPVHSYGTPDSGGKPSTLVLHSSTEKRLQPVLIMLNALSSTTTPKTCYHMLPRLLIRMFQTSRPKHPDDWCEAWRI